MALPYDQWRCSGCGRTNADSNERTGYIEERHSLGLYAGRWCDACWAASGYRQEDASAFDPADAGESYEPI